jgi:hypothetical protein
MRKFNHMLRYFFLKSTSKYALFLGILFFFIFSWFFSDSAWAIRDTIRIGETASNNGAVANATFAPDGTSWWSGNSFETAGTSTFGSTGGRVFNLTTGAPVYANYPRIPLNAQTVISDNVGGWYVAGGSTSTINEVQATTLLFHILSDGSVDSSFTTVITTTISAMALRTSTLYIGGSFVMVNGVARNRLAALNATTGALLAWNPDVNSTVSAITLDPTEVTTTIFVGGAFTTTTGNITRRRVAAWDPNGALTSWNPDVNNTVSAIAFDPTSVTSSIFVGGSFTTTTASSTTRTQKIIVRVYSGGTSRIAKIVAQTALNGTIYSGYKAKSQSRLYFTGDAENCLYVFGRNQDGRRVLTKDRYLNNGTTQNVYPSQQSFSLLGDILYVGFKTDAAVTKFYRTGTTYTSTCVYKTTINPSMPVADRSDLKQLEAVQVAFTGVASGTIAVKYSVDGSTMTSLISQSTSATEDAVSATSETSGTVLLSGKEFTFQIECTGGVSIKELRYRYSKLNNPI